MLGHRFHDRRLLLRALTHRSILPETGDDYAESNEQLEFLGDAVLDMIVAEHLCRRFPRKQEGELSKLKAMIVSGKALQTVGRKLRIGDHIRMSENEARNGGRQRGSIIEDPLEALVAALYLDGGMNTAKRFIENHILTRLERLLREPVDHNYKSRLLEYSQARGLSMPVYRVVGESGPDHAKVFRVEVSINGQVLGSGMGKSKKAAQQHAAQVAMQTLTG